MLVAKDIFPCGIHIYTLKNYNMHKQYKYFTIKVTIVNMTVFRDQGEKNVFLFKIIAYILEPISIFITYCLQ